MTSSDGGDHGVDPGSSVTPAAVVVVVVIFLLLAAIATPEAFIWLRHAGVTRVVLPNTPVVANYLLVALSLSFVVAALILRIMMVSRRTVDLRAQKTPWWSRLLAFAIVLLALRIAISSDLLRRGLGQLTRRFARPTPTATATGGVIHVPPHATSRPLGIALTILIGLILCLTVAGIALLLARVKGEVAPPIPGDPLAEVLDAGIDDLRAIADPRKAVIACYARMERLMASSGIPRLLSDTPTEFLARVLQRRSVTAASASMLTGLFERAKFSPHQVDEKMREEALVALERVRNELALV
ncbi:MAG: hypothetical protein QOH48_1536 [Actinomycetota bacterium]|jgi:hypothetical protein|nr:hypothetical protein [Actinomycetota bacterium]